MSFAYCVESPAYDTEGRRQATFRVYVGTEARAKEIVSQGPGRAWRAVAAEEMPAGARENLLRARAT